MQKLIWQNSKGEEINLTSGHYGITNWQGFSEVSSNVQSQTVPFQDGSVYLDALLDERELSVTLAIQDNNDLELRYQLRRELIHALNPKLGEGYLIYTNDFISKRIKCVANVPVFENHNSNDTGTPKANLTWTACEPYWEDLEEQEKFFSVGEIAEIENNGDIPCQVQVEFFGTSQKAQIDNLTTEKKLEVDTTIGDGIVINTNVGQKSVLRKNLNFDVVNNSNFLNSITYSSELNLFVAVGNNGTILTSKDCIKWETQFNEINGDLLSICYSEELNLFVAVGDKILTSENTLEWTVRNSGVTNGLFSVCYSSELNLFVIAGDTILTSSDGINWTERMKPIEGRFVSVTYSNNLHLFIMVGSSEFILTSSDGLNWTSQENTSNETLYDIVSSNDLIIATGYRTILTSSDGLNWTIQSGSYGKIRTITYSSELNLFVAVGNKILTSSDGINWNEKMLYINDINSICYSDELNLFVAVGGQPLGDNYQYIINSNNGIDWNINKNEINGDLLSICYSSELNLFVAVGNKILTSSDGINWNIQESSGVFLSTIIYSKSLKLFLISGQQRSIFISHDGINWIYTSIEEGSNIIAMIYSEKLNCFIAIDYLGQYISTSSDGINWESELKNLGSTVYGITYSSELNLFVAVGNKILTSSDGINWTIQKSLSIGNTIYSVDYSSNLHLFVGVGTNGRTVTSLDGLNWNENIISGFEQEQFNNIFYSKELNLFIISGPTILTSSDGINWTEKENLISGNYECSCYSSKLNKILTVGSNGTIINSDFEQAENIIQNLTEDSDMNFNLEVGENKLRLVRDNGSLTSRIKYRQKYIGV